MAQRISLSRKKNFAEKCDARVPFYLESSIATEIGAHECLAKWFIHRAIRTDSRWELFFPARLFLCKYEGLAGLLTEWIGARAGPRANDILSLDLSRFILHWIELAVYANCYSYHYTHSIIAPGDNYGLVMGHTRNCYCGASISFSAFLPFLLITDVLVNLTKTVSSRLKLW